MFLIRNLGISQINKLKSYIKLKLKFHKLYLKKVKHAEYVDFITVQNRSFYNNWLNFIKLKVSDTTLRDIILSGLNNIGYECRPIWSLMSSLPHFQKNPTMDLRNVINLQSTIINIPSSSNLIV